MIVLEIENRVEKGKENPANPKPNSSPTANPQATQPSSRSARPAFSTRPSSTPPPSAMAHPTLNRPTPSSPLQPSRGPAHARSPRVSPRPTDSHGPHIRPSFFLAPRPLLPGPPPLRALPCCWPRSTPRPSLADPTPAQSTPLLLEASPGSDRARSRVLCAIPAPRLLRDPHAEADPPLLKRRDVPAGSYLRRSHRPNHEFSHASAGISPSIRRR